MAASNIDIIIQAQDKTSTAFNSASGGLSSFRDKLDNLQPAFQNMAKVGTIAFGAVAAIVGTSVAAYQDAERSTRQLEHAVIDISKGTKEQAQAIADVSDALQKKVGIDGDALKMGAAQLSTFGLQSKSVVDLTKTLADLTVNQNGVNASSDQYVQSANIMAKALNGQFGVLEKMGIRFTEAQQKTIEFGTESEKVAAIQKGLQQNLRETTDTLGGLDVSVAKAKMSFGEVQEAIGKSFSEAVNNLLSKLEPVITKISDWVAANPQLASTILMIVGGIGGLVAVVGVLGMALPAVIAGFTLLSGPVGIIALAIGVLVAGFLAFREQIAGIMSFLEDIGVLDYFRQIWESISTTFTNVLLPAFSKLWDTLVKLKPVFEVIGTIVGGALLLAIMALAKALEIIINLFVNVLAIAMKVASFMADVFVKAFNVVRDAVQWLIDKFTTLISTIESLLATAKKIGGNVLDAIGGAINNIFKVNDAVIAPGGNVISTHPDDYLIATKDPSSLGGAGSGLTININGGTYLDENVAAKIGDMLINTLNLNMRGS